MKDLTFRNPDLFQVLPMREYFRGELDIKFPTGPEGFVVEDLDLVVRWYGKKFGLDSIGRFRLLEIKYRGARIGPAQKMTFGLIHHMLSFADPDRSRYDGYFLVQYNDETWGLKTILTINHQFKMNVWEFHDWLLAPKSPFPPFPFSDDSSPFR